MIFMDLLRGLWRSAWKAAYRNEFFYYAVNWAHRHEVTGDERTDLLHMAAVYRGLNPRLRGLFNAMADTYERTITITHGRDDL